MTSPCTSFTKPHNFAYLALCCIVTQSARPVAVSASTPVTLEDDDADDTCGAYANTAPDPRATSGAYANAAAPPSSLDQSTLQFYANVAPDGLQPTAPALAGTATPRIDDHARGCWRRLLIWITTHSYVTELRFASGEYYTLRRPGNVSNVTKSLTSAMWTCLSVLCAQQWRGRPRFGQRFAPEPYATQGSTATITNFHLAPVYVVAVTRLLVPYGASDEESDLTKEQVIYQRFLHSSVALRSAWILINSLSYSLSWT